ncbi:MBL fold metallo-hydrolase [Clostridium saudiense]|nr:MBL fold metallo-hydrolase [Clostridium saudiense]
MQIKWLGNSTFLIKTSLSKKILIDPFTPLELLDLDTTVDIITISKDFHKISNFDLNKYGAKIVTRDEVYSENNIKIKGYLSYSDNIEGLKRGKNYIYLYEIDGLRLCHLGYLGHFLNNEIISTLKNVDILFLPIGGNICLNGSESYKLSELLTPKYIIPMCYKCDNYDFYFNGPLDYISKCKNIFNANTPEINIKDFPNNTPLTVLLKH